MTITTATDVPDGVPLVKAPISLKAIRDVAVEHNVDIGEFSEAIEEIDRLVAKQARDLTEQSTRRFGEEALVFQADTQQHLYVEPSVWTEIQDELGLKEEMIRAVKAVHDRQCSLYEDRLDRVERVDEFERNDVLVMSVPMIQNLLEAGLSHQQALIQYSRMQGDSLERIQEKTGNSMRHLKSVCKRIDRKIEQAEELLVLVETPGSEGNP